MRGVEGEGERRRREKAREMRGGDSAELLTAATVTAPFLPWADSMSQAGLKSGTLSVEKVRGHISTSTVMSACDRYLRIGDPD